jgi:hypothetical protein
MFKRRTRYCMDMDVEVDYSGIDQITVERGVDSTAARAAGLDGFLEHLASTGREALQEHGQKIKGSETESSEDWASCQITFEGDPDGAAAAVNTWIAKVEELGATGRILRTRLQGTDGTDRFLEVQP